MISGSSPGERGTQGTTAFPLKTYANYTQSLNHTVRSLRDLGAEAVVSLPKISVIGSQSAGKSSLIEALCGVQLPRSYGTCTRCPVEITLRTSYHQKWKANVSLRFDSDTHDGIGPKVSFFTSVHSKEDVADILLRAQLAILNPNQNPETFRNLSASECANYQSVKAFSKSKVVLEIIGAAVDVTFIDLPGLMVYCAVLAHIFCSADLTGRGKSDSVGCGAGPILR